MIQLMYFFTNHGPAEDIIKTLWHGCEADHFLDKLKGCDYDLRKFFYELSEDNQERFCMYVIDHYHGMDSLKPLTKPSANWTAEVDIAGRIFYTRYFKQRSFTGTPLLYDLLGIVWRDPELADFLSEQEGADIYYTIRCNRPEVGRLKLKASVFREFFDDDSIPFYELFKQCEGWKEWD